MKEGKYYCCFHDFLATTKNDKSKKFLLVAEYTNFDPIDFDDCNFEVIGAIVPFVVYDTDFYNKGIISYDLDEFDDFTVINDMSKFKLNKAFFENTKSLLIMLDGLSSNITNFLDTVFELTSSDTQIIGGGAGKLTFEKDPIIFQNNNYYSNAAVIISLKNTLSIGIENGWEFLEGPFLATSSEKNVLKSLNFEPAFEVYKKVVEKDSGKKFDNDNFFEMAKSYPLGIVKYDKEIVVRDPISYDDEGNLTLVGDITQNSTLNILKGVEDELIESSGRAIEKSCTKKLKKNPHSLVLFDCISRSIFLGDRFNEELKIMKDKIKSDVKLSGALTLGEIANNGNEYITFYNKSCVVGVLC